MLRKARGIGARFLGERLGAFWYCLGLRIVGEGRRGERRGGDQRSHAKLTASTTIEMGANSTRDSISPLLRLFLSRATGSTPR